MCAVAGTQALPALGWQRWINNCMRQMPAVVELQEVATIVKPETMLGWHRTLVVQTLNGSTQRQSPGRPKIAPDLEALIVRLAQENRSWGYDRLVGAFANVGDTVSDQTVGNMLKRHGTRGRQSARRWCAKCGDTSLSEAHKFLF